MLRFGYPKTDPNKYIWIGSDIFRIVIQFKPNRDFYFGLDNFLPQNRSKPHCEDPDHSGLNLGPAVVCVSFELCLPVIYRRKNP